MKTEKEIKDLDKQMEACRKDHDRSLPYYFICDDCAKALKLEPAFPGQCVTCTIKDCERCGRHGACTPIRDFVQNGTNRTPDGKEPVWD